MNASLLGLSRRETARIFPDIERFAEIGEFILNLLRHIPVVCMCGLPLQ